MHTGKEVSPEPKVCGHSELSKDIGLLSIKDIVKDAQTQKCDSALLAQLREQILFEVC
jgi:hypothetical protein